MDAAPGDLFREAMKGAQPIRRIERAALHTPKIPPIPVQQLIDEQAVMLELAECEIDEEIALETGEEASFVRDGVPRQVLRKLRSGHWVLQGELDLHGATREEARVLVANYLRYCLDTRRRCVRIIHGKGLGSKNRVPILKSRVKQWLMLNAEGKAPSATSMRWLTWRQSAAEFLAKILPVAAPQWRRGKQSDKAAVPLPSQIASG